MTGGSAKVVVGERACMGCSYNLEGLAEDGVCPECGEAVERSLRAWTLRDAPVRFLRRTARSLTVVCVGVGMQLVGVGLIGGADQLGDPGWVTFCAGMLVLAGSIVSLLGHGRVAAEDPAVPEKQDQSVAVTEVRGFITSAVAWQLGTYAVGVVCGMLGLMVVVVPGITFGVAWWVRAHHTLRYTAWLAERGGAPGLAVTAGRCRWGLPLVVVGLSPFLWWLGVPVAGVVYLSVLWELRKLVRGVVGGRS